MEEIVKIKEGTMYSNGSVFKEVTEKNEILENDLWKERVVMESITLPRRMYRWI